MSSGSEGRNVEKIGVAFVRPELRKPKASWGKVVETGAQTLARGRGGLAGSFKAHAEDVISRI